MRTSHQQPSQHDIAGFGNAQLRLALARFILFRHQAHIGPYLPALGKSRGVFDRQQKCHRGERSDAFDLLSQCRVRVLASGQGLHLCVVRADLCGQRSHLLDQRHERRS
jgi:hypothetical protein